MRSPTNRVSSAISASRLEAGWRLAVGEGQEVHGRGLQQRLTVGQEPPRVRGLLVRVERGPVPVQLVEDPLPRRAVDMVARIDERARFAAADARGRLRHQGIKLYLTTGIGAVMIFAQGFRSLRR